MNEIYNEEIKERFLSQYDNEQTKKTIRNVFYKTYIIENTLEKDIFEQNLTEIGKCIENTNPQTKSVARSNGRFLAQYLSFCIENGYKESNLNPLKGVLSDWYDKFVDMSKKIHFSYSEFLGLLEHENMMNGQDQAFLFLIFEGVMGQRFSQLQELRFSDIDWENNTVYIKQRDTRIEVNKECIKYLQKAYEQSTYYQYNSKTKEFNEKILLDSPYIFKNVQSPRSTSGMQIGMNVLYSRLHALKEVLNLEHLTPNGIRQSGMLAYSVQLFLEEKTLAYDQLAKVGEKYDYSQISNNGYTYYNTHLMREFVNEENIKELYNIDVEIKLR